LIDAIAAGMVARERPLLAPLVAFVVPMHHLAYGLGILRGWWLVATGAWRSRLGAGPVETGR
jgi:hypothetical protein